MECKNCGQEMTSKDKFCSNCGHEIIRREIYLSQIITHILIAVLSIYLILYLMESDYVYGEPGLVMLIFCSPIIISSVIASPIFIIKHIFNKLMGRKINETDRIIFIINVIKLIIYLIIFIYYYLKIKNGQI